MNIIRSPIQRNQSYMMNAADENHICSSSSCMMYLPDGSYMYIQSDRSIINDSQIK